MWWESGTSFSEPVRSMWWKPERVMVSLVDGEVAVEEEQAWEPVHGRGGLPD